MAEADVRLRVTGVPVTQGSKTGFVVGGRAIVVDKNPGRLKPWREAVRSETVDHLGPGWQPITGPVRVLLRFALPKPASAPKRRRTWPIGARSGDLDKLTRSVLDSLTDAGLWLDDSQVVEVRALKDYPGELGETTAGVYIAVDRVVYASEPLTPHAPVTAQGALL